MGRPRKELIQPDRPPEEGAQPSVASSKPEAARTLTLRFDENGNPLPITEETRERLRKAAGGLLEEPLEELTPSSIIDEKFAGHVLDGVNEAQAFLVSRAAPLSIEEARKAVRYDADQRKELAPRLARILNRRLGGWLAKNPDVYALMVTLG